MTTFAARLEEVPWPVWIGLALAFFFCWPLALVILVCLLGNGMMGCCGMGFGRPRETTYPETLAWSPEPRASGNRAFDEYRTATVRRLEAEQREFHEFLARLRAAKDQAEFDQFMGERRGSSPRG